MKTRAVVALTTIAKPAQARRLARALVKERLAACVNIVPRVRSVYSWQGKLREEAEALLVMKTTARRVPALQRRLRQLHPYECPEFIVLPIARGSPDYLNWLLKSTR